MRLLKIYFSIVFAASIAACGGGGGNASAPGGSTDGKTVVTRLTASLQDSSGASVQSIPVSGGGQVVVALTDSTGAVLANQTVKLSEGTTGLISFPGGLIATTDSKGLATVKVNRKTQFKFGIGTFAIQFDAPSCSTANGNNCLSAASGSLDFRASPPAFKLVLLDSNSVVTNTIGTSGTSQIRATLKFEDGTTVDQKRVDIAGDLTKVSFPEGSSRLTEQGISLVKIARASQSANGAGTVTASATIAGADASGSIDSTVVTGTLDYNLGLAVGNDKLTLSNLDVGVTSLPAYGTRQVSVQASLGGIPASVPVTLTFAANCGQVQPSSITTNSAGIATVSYTATDAQGVTPSNLGCSGRTVEISASAVGADAVRKSISVTVAPATNLAFVVPADSTRMRIYLEGSGGATQAVIQFLLTNALGEAIPSQDVQLTLKTTNSGIPKATFGSKGNTSAILLTTDASGKVSVPVFAGTVPTSVLVNAALVSNTAIQTNSSLLAIASGRPTQSSLSLSLGKFAIRGFNFDGEETTVTLAMSDRQGNPVPDGTAVNFTAESGVMIPPICTTGNVPGDSRCTVKFRSQGTRPADGRVSILAYAAGEESFVDSVGDNVYHCGDTFTDLGIAYRDDTARTSGVPVGGTNATGQVPRSAAVSTCGTGVVPTAASGDGVWGTADVRQQAVIVYSTDDMKISSAVWTSAPSAQWGGTVVTTGLVVSLSDLNNNSVPTGSTIVATAIDATPSSPAAGVLVGTCTLLGISNDAVPNSLDPLSLGLFLKDCVTGDQVKISVTTPYAVKSFTLSVP